MIIEPCCFEKQLTDTIHRIEGRGNVAHLFTNSDVELSLLLTYFVNRAPMGELTVVMPVLEENTLEALRKMMVRHHWDASSRESKKLLSKLTIITQGKNRDRILAYFKELDDRLTICEDAIGFRLFTYSNGKHHYTLQGSLNQSMVTATQMFTLTTSQMLYEEAMEAISSKERVKRVKDWKSVYERMIKNEE